MFMYLSVGEEESKLKDVAHLGLRSKETSENSDLCLRHAARCYIQCVWLFISERKVQGIQIVIIYFFAPEEK